MIIKLSYFGIHMIKLKSNKAKCLVCNTIVESKHRRDFCWCECGAMYVDGGLDYLRRGGTDLSKIQDMSEYEETVDTTPKQ